jgi:hypothetical protein
LYFEKNFAILLCSSPFVFPLSIRFLLLSFLSEILQGKMTFVQQLLLKNYQQLSLSYFHSGFVRQIFGVLWHSSSETNAPMNL